MSVTPREQHENKEGCWLVGWLVVLSRH